MEETRGSLTRSPRNASNDVEMYSESYSDDGIGVFAMNDHIDDDIDDNDIYPQLVYSPVTTQENFIGSISNILLEYPTIEIDDHNIFPEIPQLRKSAFNNEKIISDGIIRQEQTVSCDLLDIVCSGRLLPSQSTFSFFKRDSLKRLTSGNIWAGSSHWKAIQKSNAKDSVKVNRKKRSTHKTRDVVDGSITSNAFLDLYALIEGPLYWSHQPSKRKVKEDSLVELNEKIIPDKHILPIDAGMTIDHLASFFLRPHSLFLNGSEHSISNHTHQEPNLTSNIGKGKIRLKSFQDVITFIIFHESLSCQIVTPILSQVHTTMEMMNHLEVIHATVRALGFPMVITRIFSPVMTLKSKNCRTYEKLKKLK